MLLPITAAAIIVFLLQRWRFTVSARRSPNVMVCRDWLLNLRALRLNTGRHRTVICRSCDTVNHPDDSSSGNAQTGKDCREQNNAAI